MRGVELEESTRSQNGCLQARTLNVSNLALEAGADVTPQSLSLSFELLILMHFKDYHLLRYSLSLIWGSMMEDR